MLALILAILFGLAFSFIATQNTDLVSLKAGGYIIEAIPLYLVAIGSLLIGLILGWLLHLVSQASNLMTLVGKDHQIKQSEKTTQELQKKLHDLEVENARLEESTKTKIVKEKTYANGDTVITEEKPKKSFLASLRS